MHRPGPVTALAPLVATEGRELEVGLLALVVALAALVGYWVYRDADDRGMADAAYWGAAVSALFVVGVGVGGVLATGVYLARRPDERVVDDDEAFLAVARREDDADDRQAELKLSPTRVAAASDTAIRGYARRVDGVDPTADPEALRAELRRLAEERAAVDAFEWQDEVEDA